MSSLTRRLLWPVVVSGVAMLALIFWRRYLWHHALMVSIAAGALTYSIGRSFEQLRDVWKK